ncbi:hypothetical protein GJ744_001264 [Endocarpon pusillum]|uniref:Uncharacterized protein n=1 Tax=Endocarpon pusillum TaxID=364733 RepID=A0A8H7ABU9_9EURO|nr:hypothetical protein GJ744_001264 [Endocarpon pusillum]
MAHTQRYYVDGHVRTRMFQPEHHQDSSSKDPVQEPQQQRKTEMEAHHVNKSSESVRDPANRKHLLYALKEKIPKRKKKAPKEKSANPGLFRILFLGGRWALGEDVEPGLSNRTKYAAPSWGWRPYGGTRER